MIKKRKEVETALRILIYVLTAVLEMIETAAADNDKIVIGKEEH